jgi:hypothetical protein
VGACAAAGVGIEAWREGLLVSKSIQDLFNKAVHAFDKDEYDRGIESLNPIINLYDLMHLSFIQRGRANWEMRRWDEAIKDFELSLRMKPDSADANWTVGLITLQMGDFAKGWAGYEWRWKSDAFKSPKLKTKLPRWEPDKGYESVLVWCEQGIGDQIIYGSLLPALQKITPNVTAMVDGRLLKLFARGMPGIKFVSHEAKIKNSEYQSQIPIGSLGSAFIHSFEDVPKYRAIHHVKANPDRAAAVRKELGINEDDFVVGLSWASTAPRVGVHKSIALKDLAPIFDLPNVKVVNLQYGEPKKEIDDFEKSTGKRVHQSFVNTFFDLEGVAAIIENCDVVVACSNANVHLAGGMGKPVLVFDANKLWYWNCKEGDRSTWYPSVRLFPRKNMIAPWDDQVALVMDALKEMHDQVTFITDAFKEIQ